MSIWVSLEMRVKTGRYEELLPFLQQNLPNVRGFPGAFNISLFHDEQSRDLLIFEEWLSRDHHQHYIQYISENGVMNTLISFMEGPPSVKYYGKLIV